MTPDLDLSPELAERRRAEKVQAALYRIAELASAAQDLQEFYRAMHDVVGELMDATNFFIALYDEQRQLINWPYYVDEVDLDIPDPHQWDAFGEGNARGTTAYVLRTGEPQLLDYERMLELIEQGEIELVGVTVEDSSWIGVPLKAEGHTIGVLVVQSYTKRVQYTQQDKALLAFVGQHVGSALSRARAIEETRQRNAELAFINSVQSAIAGELDPQAIYDVVGDKLQEVFDAQVVDIGIYDEASGVLNFPYTIELGVRYPDEPLPLIGFRRHVLETREPLLLNENLHAEGEKYGNPEVLTGAPTKSGIWMPVVSGDKAIGVISLQNVDREHAFTEADLQLLTTLTGSLSVALENARLVQETQQRNSELALINSVQVAIAGELDLQAVYDLVGDKIREVFDAQSVAISTLDQATGLQHYPYLIEGGERMQADPSPVGGFTKHVLDTREPLLINDDVAAAAELYGSYVVAGDWPKSVLFAPLVTGDRGTGAISLQNIDREYAFTDSDERLLVTLAGSLSAALENARLIHETRQRNAELALINSVQEALAGELELQAIYDVVGDKIQEVFDAQVVDIGIYDETAQLIHFPYTIERGVRYPDETLEVIGFRKHVLETREPLLISENMPEASEAYGNPQVLTGEPSKSGLWVPLVSGGTATGVISLQNADREHAFTDADVRLLMTLGGSLSVALENARLVHETRQRNAELALINSVQEALAGELELQAIYDVVGDKIQEIFDAQVVDIGIFDVEAGLAHYPYTIERGVRFPDEPSSIAASPTTQIIFQTKAAILINDVPAWEVEHGVKTQVLQGEPSLSMLVAPLISGDEVRGRISLQNLDRTNAFSGSDVRLLTTLAGSLSVALENARLVHETRQRNAELALINSVQEAIAGELDPLAMYDHIGDKLQEVFDAQVVSISVLNEATGLLEFPYVIERGERLQEDPIHVIGFRKHVLEAREPLMLHESTPEVAEQYGNPYVLSGEPVKSALFVPLIVGGRAYGVISLQNVDRTHAFTDADQRLLATLAGSLSVALENARLVHETRQRNAELAFINSVQAAIAGELDPQAIYDIVGDRIQEIFDSQVVTISTLDEATRLLHYPYMIERAERMQPEPRPLGGFAKHVLETRMPLLINENVAGEAERYGSTIVAGAAPKSVLFVPLVTGGRPTGVVSLQNVDREHAFTDSDERLLVTLAGSLGAALENARLVEQTEQRNAELALINSVQEAIAGELDPQAIYDLVGDRIQEVFDAQCVDINVYDETTGLVHFPYSIEGGNRYSDEPLPLEGLGWTRHVMETGRSVLVREDVVGATERFGLNIVLSGTGTPPKSLLFVPLVTGGKAKGAIALQNVDREHAFSDSDQQLLETLARSVSVALENARLVHETRQRVAELATVNSIGQALATQLELERLIELVGDRLEEVFDADIVYVALHDESAGRIDFAYYSENGIREAQSSLKYGEGLTSQILDSRVPLVLNRTEQYEEVASTRIGTPSLSFLGVPIFLGEKAIGVISVQSTREAGRFGDAETGLLATIAASLGVALQNARLFEEQREAERKYRELVEQLPLTVYTDFPDVNATSEYVSPRIETMFGYPPEAWMDSEFFPSVLHPDDRERVLGEQEEWLSGNVDRWTNDYRVFAADGRTVWVRDDAWIAKDEEGKPSRVHGFMIDITEQTLAEQEIRRQKQYFESLVGVSPVAIVVMDADERVTGWNPAAAELFGWSTEEAVGKLIDELVFSEDSREEGRDVTREALETGRAQRMGRRARKDGALVDVELMLVPLTVDGERVGFYAIYHDITELERARAEAEAATNAKSAFLATMSHEIRTPMNAVIGMTDLLLGTELTSEQREFADVVRSSGDALLHVIDDILDYSKIEAGKLELEQEPFDLRECVEGALEIAAPRASDKEIELGCLIDEDAPAGLVGDAARLRQVLLNLLSNAVKFTEKGEVVVHVDAESTRAGSYRIELAVRDTGIGIPQDRIEGLFTSFTQVDASTTRRYGGTGLGLAISKRLVELMGGTISVESEEGVGSTFRISLPADAAEVPSRITPGDGLPQLIGKRILIVDDNATNREIVTRHARSWGMEPVAVELPMEAIALVERGEQFDVAILDMMMPDMDGIALAHEIRRHRSERELPFLLLTSLGRLPHARSTRAFSAQLAKPVRASQLYNALVRLVATDTEAPEAGEVAPDGKPRTSTLRILLAEDNAVNQKVALRLLERLGYGADVVWNGREALEALERRPYDVVLMDVQMPELDGLDATRQICARWPAEARPRVIAMTANAMPEDREACLAAGMDDYVAKPIRPDDLAQALGQVKRRERQTEPRSDEGGATLDAAAIESLRELGGDDFLAEVIDTFLADAPALVAALRRSLDAEDPDELRRAAHTLKSNGATLGADGFSELCRELERRAKAGQLADASGLVDRVEKEYSHLQEALAALGAGAAS